MYEFFLISKPESKQFPLVSPLNSKVQDRTLDSMMSLKNEISSLNVSKLYDKEQNLELKHGLQNESFVKKKKDKLK